MISKNMISFLEPKSPISEAYRMIRTNIHYSSFDKELKVILVTSSGMAEGKSTTAGNLALTMAQAGSKVLLLDCDLRKPRVHKHFDLNNNVGITNIIVENKEITEVVKKIEKINNMEFITSGPIPPDPSELIGSQKMRDLLSNLKSKYDYVIIDAPPVGLVTDAVILGGIVDGVVLVVASAQSKIELAKQAKRALDNVGARILGAVITKIDKSSSSYYYYSNYGNENYYGEDSLENNNKSTRSSFLKRCLQLVRDK